MDSGFKSKLYNLDLQTRLVGTTVHCFVFTIVNLNYENVEKGCYVREVILHLGDKCLGQNACLR